MTLPDDVAWLVECPKYHPGEYFALCECGCGRHHWTKDVHAATKFPTKDAAEAARGGDQNCIAFEHMFGLKLPRTTALPDDVVELAAKAMKPQLFSGRPDSEVGPVTKYERDFARGMARAALEAARWGEMREALMSAHNSMGTTTDCLNSGEPSRHRYAEQRLQREMDSIRALLSTIGAA